MEFLLPREGPVLEGCEERETVFGENQPGILPLRTLASIDAQRVVMSRWTPTQEQRKAIAEGGDIFACMATWGNRPMPFILFVADETDTEVVKHYLWATGNFEA